MLHYSTISVCGKHDIVAGASFAENEAERNKKSKSCKDDGIKELTDDASDEVHEGISDAKKVRFTADLDSNVTVTSTRDHKY